MKPIISKNAIRYKNFFTIGEYSIVDDYCYFSTQVAIGKYCHIASGVSIAGGKDTKFVLGNYSGISSGAKIWCSSSNFVDDLVTIIARDIDIGLNSVSGDVIMGPMTGVGSNAVIMPNNIIPEGVVIGALSFVPSNFPFEPWGVYAGSPIRLIKKRNKENVLRQVKLLEK